MVRLMVRLNDSNPFVLDEISVTRDATSDGTSSICKFTTINGSRYHTSDTTK